MITLQVIPSGIPIRVFCHLMDTNTTNRPFFFTRPTLNTFKGKLVNIDTGFIIDIEAKQVISEKTDVRKKTPSIYEFSVYDTLPYGTYIIRTSGGREGYAFNIIENNSFRHQPPSYKVFSILLYGSVLGVLENINKVYERVKQNSNALDELNGSIENLVTVLVTEKLAEGNEALVIENIQRRAMEEIKEMLPNVIDKFVTIDFDAKLQEALSNYSKTEVAKYINSGISSYVSGRTEVYDKSILELKESIDHIKGKLQQSNVLISDDGYWVVNGNKTNIKAEDNTKRFTKDLGLLKGVYIKRIRTLNEGNYINGSKTTIAEIKQRIAYENSNIDEYNPTAQFTDHFNEFILYSRNYPKDFIIEFTLYSNYNTVITATYINSKGDLIAISNENDKSYTQANDFNYYDNNQHRKYSFNIKDCASNIYLTTLKSGWVSYGNNSIRFIKVYSTHPILYDIQSDSWTSRPMNLEKGQVVIIESFTPDGRNIPMYFDGNNYVTMFGSIITGETKEEAYRNYLESLKTIIPINLETKT